jgi:hypothetical protein
MEIGKRARKCHNSSINTGFGERQVLTMTVAVDRFGVRTLGGGRRDTPSALSPTSYSDYSGPVFRRTVYPAPQPQRGEAFGSVMAPAIRVVEKTYEPDGLRPAAALPEFPR